MDVTADISDIIKDVYHLIVGFEQWDTLPTATLMQWKHKLSHVADIVDKRVTERTYPPRLYQAHAGEEPITQAG